MTAVCRRQLSGTFPGVLLLLHTLMYAVHGPCGARADMIVDRDVTRPDRFWSTLASNCQDSYCSGRGAVAAGHCLCQCPKAAATLDIGAGLCVSTLSDCKDFLIGSSSEGVTTVDIVNSTADLQPALALLMNGTNGSASVPTSVASTLACPIYIEADYLAGGSSSWTSISTLGLSIAPFAVRDDGRNMFLQWRSPGQSALVAGKIVKVWLGCGKRDDPYAFRSPYCVAVKFKGQDSVPEVATTATPTTPAPFVATKFFVIIICVLAAVVFIASVTCLACCLISRRELRGRPEMVVYSVPVPGGGGPLGGGPPLTQNGRSGGSAPLRLPNGVNMHPTAANGYALDRPDAGRSAAPVAAAGAQSLTRSQAYHTLDRSRTRESQDSGVGRSAGPSHSSHQSRVERSDDDTVTAAVVAATSSPSSSASGEQASNGNRSTAAAALDEAEIERHLLDFEGTKLAHKRRNSPRELFKSRSERLTTVGASFAAATTAESDSSRTGGPSWLSPTAGYFLSRTRVDGGERRRKEAVGSKRAARRSRSARYPGRGIDPAALGDDSASDSSVGVVPLEHFTSDRAAAAAATGSLRSPRRFTDGHVNKDVTFNADGTVIVPNYFEPGRSGGSVDTPAAAGPSDGPLYSSVARPRFASIGGRSGTAGTSALGTRAETPVTAIDDLVESDESDAAPAPTRIDAVQQPPPPPPPPSRPPPSILYSSPDDERAEMFRSRGGGGSSSGRHSLASRASTLRR